MVHVILLGAFIFSFNWKAAHTVVMVSEVELWNELPAISKPAPTKPKIKEIPKIKPPEPVVEPKVVEPKIEEPKVEQAKPEVDIALEKKKKEAEKLAEQKKKDAEKLAEQKKKEDAERAKKIAELQKKVLAETDTKEIVDNEEFKKLQAEMRGETTQPSAAVNQGLVDEYIGKITSKVRGNVNKALCGDGNPELAFKVNLLPNGEFGDNPRLTKSSGNAACDGAVERAIIASEPFPLPSDPDALSKFRNLNLKFKPNAD